MLNRDEWDKYFMKMAVTVASRSTCLRRHVGAVAVREKRIVATGYNGAPAGMKHCDEVGCLRELNRVPSGQRHELCRAVHAEQNCIAQAARFGESLEGCTLFCTTAPCAICAKLLINTGFVRIVSNESYPDEMAKLILEEANVMLEVTPNAH